jgi:hypothetical protein
MDTMQQPIVEEPKISSFFDRMSNIFTSPGAVYSEVANAPVQSSSWSMPFIFSLIFAVLSTIAVLSNASLKEQALAPQRQAMQERVDKGEMTQEQMDQATAVTESGTITMIVGSISAMVMVAVGTFGGALIFWLAWKLIFKMQAGYKKVLEVYGLAMLIGILGSIVTILMMFVFDSLYASPGGGLLVMNNFNRHNFGHMMLAAFNIVSIWQMSVTGIGLAKVSGKSQGSSIGLALGLWVVWIIILSIIGGLR